MIWPAWALNQGHVSHCSQVAVLVTLSLGQAVTSKLSTRHFIRLQAYALYQFLMHSTVHLRTMKCVALCIVGPKMRNFSTILGENA